MLRLGTAEKDWEQIKEGVAKALRRDKICQDAEVVKAELEAGIVKLLICDDYFVIVQLYHLQFGKKPDLLCRIAFSFVKEDILQRMTDETCMIAKELGCAGVLSFATRKGYERKRPANWHQLYTAWRVKL